jgi:hypothetical protein
MDRPGPALRLACGPSLPNSLIRRA